MPRYSQQNRERALRLVQDGQGQHNSQWATIVAVSTQIGCAPSTLRRWMRDAEGSGGRMTTRENLKSNDGVSPEALTGSLLIPFLVLVVPLALFVPVGLVLLFFEFTSLRSTGRAINSSQAALDYLAALPINPGLYGFLALLIGLVAAWRSWVHLAQTHNNGDIGKHEGTPELNLRISHEQRRRAVALRTGAMCILAGVVFVLAGGLYVVLFVLPTVVRGYDAEAAPQVVFRNRYADELDSLVVGEYWLSLPNEVADSPSPLKDVMLTFENSGDIGLAALKSSDGEVTILVTTDRGRSWSVKPNLQLDRSDFLAKMALATDGSQGLLVTMKGTTFRTTDDGDTWRRMTNLKPSEDGSIIASWYRPRSNEVLVLDDTGSIHSTGDWGETWDPEDLMEPGDKVDGSITEVAVSANGTEVVVGYDTGTIDHWSLDRSPKWHRHKRTFQDGEWLVAAAFGANDSYRVEVGNRGTLNAERYLDNDEVDSMPKGLPGVSGGWAVVSLAKLGPSGVLVSAEGYVFTTSDSGGSWVQVTELELEYGELIEGRGKGDFGADAVHGVLAGSGRSVFVTNDGGLTWRSTERLDTEHQFRAVAIVGPDRVNTHYTAVAVDAVGGLYLLTPHQQLTGWRNWNSEDLLSRMRDSSVRASSDLVKEIGKLAPAQVTAGTVGGLEVGSHTGAEALLNPLLFLRVFTLTVLFFLVSLLVRLYQYNLRLAAFWEARSDAVLLAGALLQCDAKSFDELASALSPDAYDFKPGPQPTTEGLARRLWRMRDS